MVKTFTMTEMKIKNERGFTPLFFMPFFIGTILPKSKIKNHRCYITAFLFFIFYFSFLKFKIENPEGLVVGNLVGNRPTDLMGRCVRP